MNCLKGIPVHARHQNWNSMRSVTCILVFLPHVARFECLGESRNLRLLHKMYTQKQQHSLNHSCSDNTLESQGELEDGLPQGKNLEEMNQV